MSPITLTGNERCTALMQFGYTQREAEFLVVAALQGGFFLRRQYCDFIDRAVGGTAASFIEKAISKGHATAVLGYRNAKLYHLCSRPFYAALGQENSRNRRQRPPAGIKNRLMGLDFVLAHPMERYLSTEEEKVSFFTRSLGLAPSELPVKLFRSPQAQEATTRCFVDKYPLFVSEAPLSSPVVSFCFIDEGLSTESRFESYLRQYERLLPRVENARIIYVAASEISFRHAARTFQRIFPAASARSLDEASVIRILGHFKERSLYDARQFSGMDRTTLIRLRNERQEFSGPFFDELFALWFKGGEVAVRERISSETYLKGRGGVRFSTYLLRQNYDIFGSRATPDED